MVVPRLREETAVAHRQLEALLDLGSPQLSIERYIRILQGFLAIFAPWEEALTRHCPEQFAPIWRGRQRSHLLQADLATLGAEADPTLAELIPSPPDFQDAGTWLGAMYVLEGSRLGGQHISRHLEASFGWSGGAGYSFFRGKKDEVASHWRALLGLLEENSNQSNQIVYGAHRTFIDFYRGFGLTLKSSSFVRQHESG